MVFLGNILETSSYVLCITGVIIIMVDWSILVGTRFMILNTR